MFSLQQVWTPVVVLNGLAAVREALVYRSQDTADRPPPAVYEHLGYGPRAEGKRRGQGRRFSVQERANEFEGAAGGERRLCQTLGEEKLDEAEGGALLREGGPGPLRTRRGRRCGQERGQCRCGQVWARTFPTWQTGSPWAK